MGMVRVRRDNRVLHYCDGDGTILWIGMRF